MAFPTSGVTRACLKIFGNHPLASDKLINFVIGEIRLWHFRSNQVGIGSRLLQAEDFIMLKTSTSNISLKIDILLSEKVGLDTVIVEGVPIL